MKGISYTIFLFFTMFCIVTASTMFGSNAKANALEIATPAIAQNASEVVIPPVAKTEALVLVKGQTLWKHFVAQKLPRRDWPQYRKDACALSDITCTDPAWRKLPIGKLITVPRDPRAVLAETQSRELIAQQEAIEKIAQKIAEDERLVNSLLEKIEKNENDLRTLALLAQIVATALMLVLFLAFIFFVIWPLVFKSRSKDDEVVPENVERINEDQFFRRQHSSSPLLLGFSGVDKSGSLKSSVRHIDKYLPSETPHATYPPRYVTEVDSSFGPPAVPATESGEKSSTLESDTAIAPNMPPQDTNVASTVVANARPGSL